MSIAKTAKILLWRGLQQCLVQSAQIGNEAAEVIREIETLTCETKQAAPVYRGGDNHRVAAKLRELADGMQDEIDGKLNSATSQQRWTQRRADQAASMRADGHRLEQDQACLRWLADQWEMNVVPGCLRGVKTKSGVQDIRFNSQGNPERYAKYKMAGIGDWRRAKEYFDTVTSGVKSTRDPVKEMEDGLRGLKIDGFFPTPRSVWDWMGESFNPVDLLHEWVNRRIKHDDSPVRVLEPSAGIGSLLDYMKESFAAVKMELSAFEVNYKCCEVLRAKGYTTSSLDFLEVENTEFADCIIMNPPFENRADATHVMHAYKCLKPGGFLLAIMSAGPFFAGDATSMRFRTWLNCLDNTTSTALPDGAFNGPDAFRPTGVNCTVITITKSEDMPF